MHNSDILGCGREVLAVHKAQQTCSGEEKACKLVHDGEFGSIELDEIAIRTAFSISQVRVYEHASRRLTTGKKDVINDGRRVILNDEEERRMLPYPAPPRKIAR